MTYQVARVRQHAWPFDLKRSTTPGRLRWASLMIALVAALQGVTGTVSLFAARNTIDAIGHSTVPVAIEVQKVHESLAEADRSAANAFLSGNVEAPAIRRQYELAISTADTEIEQLAEDNGLGVQATRELRAIMQMLSDYTGLIEAARANNLQGFPVGATYLRSASGLMHRPGDGMLARVDALAALDRRSLSAENVDLLYGLLPLAAFLVCDLVLIFLLIRTQVFLRWRFRRRRNRRMLGATAVLFGLMALAAVQGTVSYFELGIAQQQTFSRLQTVWQARSLAADANGNESLSLISRGNGAAFDAAFKAETTRLVDRPLTDGLVGSAAGGHVRFRGLLADELNQARLPQERGAVLLALRAYRDFLAVDGQVRAKAAAHDLRGAAALALGTQGGQLGAAFSRLDAALARAIAIDQGQYDSAIGWAEPGLALALAIPACAVAIALLAIWGLEPRIAEYR
jgi:hypothetical protein